MHVHAGIDLVGRQLFCFLVPDMMACVLQHNDIHIERINCDRVGKSAIAG